LKQFASVPLDFSGNFRYNDDLGLSPLNPSSDRASPCVGEHLTLIDINSAIDFRRRARAANHGIL